MRPICTSCGKRTIEKNFEFRKSMCPRCFRLSTLEPFNALHARALIRDWLTGTHFDRYFSLKGAKSLSGCVGELRRRMRPPDDQEWSLPLVAQIWVSGLNWPMGAA